uniref:Spt5_N domain-containing protein n=1 Tax=Syphacia muris TaxID=451379 RepID=A0A0N5A9L0_9BILA
IEEEASLSGDDVGSDLEDDEGPDEYEEEDGVEELPDEETIRLNVHKQWLRQQRDDEYRRLMYWKDQLLPEGDLYKETNRSFRLKLRDEAENSVDENHENEKVLTKIDDCAEDEETRRRHIEMVKWKMENRVNLVEEKKLGLYYFSRTSCQLFHVSGSCDKRYSEESNDTHKNAEIKNSLLQNRCSLSTIVNHNDNGNLLSGNTRGLYINRAIQVFHFFGTELTAEQYIVCKI